LFEAEDGQRHADRDDGGARPVDARGPPVVGDVGDPGHDEGRDRDRNVDPEDGAPRPLRQVAARDGADGGQAAADREEDGQRVPSRDSDSSDWIVGAAMATMVWSMNVIATANRVAASVRFFELRAVGTSSTLREPRIARA
jgi:hypothetical protein